MTITDTEQVAVGRLIEVWAENKAVLINFIGVVWDVAYPRCKGIFCHNVPLDVQRISLVRCNLLLRCRLILHRLLLITGAASFSHFFIIDLVGDREAGPLLDAISSILGHQSLS